MIVFIQINRDYRGGLNAGSGRIGKGSKGPISISQQDEQSVVVTVGDRHIHVAVPIEIASSYSIGRIPRENNRAILECQRTQSRKDLNRVVQTICNGKV